MGKNQVPKSVNIGPGQAPANANPSPKIMPPSMYLMNPFSFGMNLID